MSRDACPIDPTDPTPTHSTEPPPRQPVGSATKREFCNEKVKVRTRTADAMGSLFRGFRLTKTVTCADSLVTADNRALNELGPIGSAHLMRASRSTERENDSSGLDGIQRLQARTETAIDQAGVGRGTKRRRDPRGT